MHAVSATEDLILPTPLSRPNTNVLWPPPRKHIANPIRIEQRREHNRRAQQASRARRNQEVARLQMEVARLTGKV